MKDTTDRNSEENISPIRESFLDFHTKMKNPDFNTPTGKHHDKQKTIESLKDIYENVKDAAGKLDLTQMCLDFEIPGSGNMIRMEWIYFMIYHTQRHTHQSKNILETLEGNKQ